MGLKIRRQKLRQVIRRSHNNSTRSENFASHPTQAQDSIDPSMEDEEEIQSSPPSPPPPSSASHQPVTVAAPPPQNILTLALPIQQPRSIGGGGVGGGGSGGGGGGGGTGGGREDCWSEGATSMLIHAWGERYLELSRGNLKQQHWKEVADIVSSREDYSKTPKTDVQCKNRIDTLKKKYKTEKAKVAAGQGPSAWMFFHRLDRLIGPNAKVNAGIGATSVAASKIPTAIPVDVRTLHRSPQRQKQQYQMPDSSSEELPPSPDSTDSLPPETFNRKRPRVKTKPEFRRQGKSWGDSVRELSQAIVDFGEAYERIETSKLQQMVEMEKRRMVFAKDLEVQRMQFLMKTQLELTQLKQGTRVSSNHNKKQQ